MNLKSWSVSAAVFLAGLSVWAEALVGQSAPDFAATDINGRAHRLSEYRGKVVVIEAYNPDCPFCANHYKTGAMQALQGNVVGKGVIWLVVNSAPTGSAAYRQPSLARKEFTELGMKATAMLDDHTGAVGKKLGLRTTPQLVVIDQQGVVAYQGAIDDRPASSGDPRTARNYVRQAVEALLAGKPVPAAEAKPYGTAINYAN